MTTGCSVFTRYQRIHVNHLRFPNGIRYSKMGSPCSLVRKPFPVCEPQRNWRSNRQLVFGLVLFLKRGRMESLLEEMHPEALPPFAWIRKHWRMSTMTFPTSLLPSRRPWVTGTLSSLVSGCFFCFCFCFCQGQISTNNGIHSSTIVITKQSATAEHFDRLLNLGQIKFMAWSNCSSAESLAMTASQYLASSLWKPGFLFLKFLRFA